MKKKVGALLAIAGLMAGAGCASKKETRTSAVDQVTNVKASVDKTDEYITKAQRNINELEQSLAEIRQEALASRQMRGKQSFQNTLIELNANVRESKQRLAELKAANRQSFEVYRSHLDAARADMDSSFQQQLDEDAAVPQQAE